MPKDKIGPTPVVECSSCGKEFVAPDSTTLCPHCGAFGAMRLPKKLTREQVEEVERGLSEKLGKLTKK